MMPLGSNENAREAEDPACCYTYTRLKRRVQLQEFLGWDQAQSDRRHLAVRLAQSTSILLFLATSSRIQSNEEKIYKRLDRKGGKTETRWVRPYTIRDITANGLYLLRNNKNVDIKSAVNFGNLKPYYMNNNNNNKKKDNDYYIIPLFLGALT